MATAIIMPRVNGGLFIFINGDLAIAVNAGRGVMSVLASAACELASGRVLR